MRRLPICSCLMLWGWLLCQHPTVAHPYQDSSSTSSDSDHDILGRKISGNSTFLQVKLVVHPLSGFSVPVEFQPKATRGGIKAWREARARLQAQDWLDRGGGFNGGLPSGTGRRRKRTRTRSTKDPRQGSNSNSNPDDLYTGATETGMGAYTVPVTIGSTGQKVFNLVFDTGSSNLWVLGPEVWIPYIVDGNVPQCEEFCESGSFPIYPAQHQNYEYTQLGGEQVQGQWLSISYGQAESGNTNSGLVSGQVVNETIVMGGYPTTLQIGVITEMAPTFTLPSYMDGVIGMAFCNGNRIYPKKPPGFLETVLPQLNLSVFTADLKMELFGNSSTFDFGFIDESKYTGEIEYVPVNKSSSYWQVGCTAGFTVGDIHYPDAGCSEVIVDTGFPFIAVPLHVTNEYYAQVSGASNDSGAWLFPCDGVMPDIALPIGDKLAIVPGCMNMLPWLDTSSPNTCIGALQTLYTTDLPENLLKRFTYGTAFLEAGFAVFDFSNTRFGWASKPGVSCNYTTTASSSSSISTPFSSSSVPIS